MPRTNFLRAACLALTLGGAALALHACDGGSEGGSSGKPTAAEIKTACNAAFDKGIGCGDPIASIATNYKASTCTDANVAAFAACSTSRALLEQAKSCEKLECAQLSGCALGLVGAFQACLPDGGT